MRTLIPVLLICLRSSPLLANPSPSFVQEDSLPLPTNFRAEYGDAIHIRDLRPKLKDVLAKCIHAERERFSGVQDLAYRDRVRALVIWGDPADTSSRRVVNETVTQNYFRAPDQAWSEPLGSREYDAAKRETKVELDFDTGSSARRLSDLPFFFEDLDRYDFRIDDRRVVMSPAAHDSVGANSGGMQDARVLYQIAFTPRSDFDATPEGWFLVDTSEYRILHFEMRWTDNVPFPAFLKGIDRVVVTRSKHGGVWLDDRIAGVIRLRSLPRFPSRVEFDLRTERVRVNEGVADSLFRARGR